MVSLGEGEQVVVQGDVGGALVNGWDASIMVHFRDLDDLRIERRERHQLLDIITIALCAVICGADSWVYVGMFGRSKEEWSRTFLVYPTELPPTTPSVRSSPG